jgi:hypothetical protein
MYKIRELSKIDRGESFVLAETLPAASYHHAHLPGAINLRLTKLRSSHLHSCRIKRLTSWFTVQSQLEMLRRTPLVIWLRWATRRCATMPEVSRTGLMPDCLPKASTSI